jgi:hypothetical protein
MVCHTGCVDLECWMGLIAEHERIQTMERDPQNAIRNMCVVRPEKILLPFVDGK